MVDRMMTADEMAQKLQQHREASRKRVAPHMYVLSRVPTGGFLVTLGDPTSSRSKIVQGPIDKDELKFWVKDNVGSRISADHVIDITGMKLVPAEFSEFSERLATGSNVEARFTEGPEGEKEFKVWLKDQPQDVQDEWAENTQKYKDKFDKKGGAFSKGDRVKIMSGKHKGLDGTVTYVGSGPKGDQVSVQINHPVHKVMGPAILDPKNIRKVGQHSSAAESDVEARFTEGPEGKKEFDAWLKKQPQEVQDEWAENTDKYKDKFDKKARSKSIHVNPKLYYVSSDSGDTYGPYRNSRDAQNDADDMVRWLDMEVRVDRGDAVLQDMLVPGDVLDVIPPSDVAMWVADEKESMQRYAGAGSDEEKAEAAEARAEADQEKSQAERDEARADRSDASSKMASHQKGADLDRRTLDQMVEMAAESSELENYSDASATREVLAEAKKFEQAVERALTDWVKKHPLAEGYDVDDLMDEEASYNIMMTLMGHGVGIWDGRWDHFFDDEREIKDLEKFLERALGKYANDSGTGSLVEAFDNAAWETAASDEDQARYASRRKAAARRKAARKITVEDLEEIGGNTLRGGEDLEALAKILNRASGRAAGRAMQEADKILGTFGVEAIWGEGSYTEPVAEYLNVGDPYVLTIVHDMEEGEIAAMGYGDWIEEFERRGGHTRAASSDKTAAVKPGGLYGFTKKDQKDCEASIRKVQRQAMRIAKVAASRDPKVATFLATHAKRARSIPARIMISAFKGLQPKLASDHEARVVDAVQAEKAANAIHKLLRGEGGRATQKFLKALGYQPDPDQQDKIRLLKFDMEDEIGGEDNILVQKVHKHWITLLDYFSTEKLRSRGGEEIPVRWPGSYVSAVGKDGWKYYYSVLSNGAKSVYRSRERFTYAMKNEAQLPGKMVEELLRKLDGGRRAFEQQHPSYSAIMEVYDEIPMRTARNLRIKGKPDTSTILEMDHPSGNRVALHFQDGEYQAFVNGKRKRLPRMSSKNLAKWLDDVFVYTWSDDRMKSASDKEAAFGLYGYKAKTATMGLNACTEIRAFSGQVAYDLHNRRQARHANLSGFFKQHAKEGRCHYARLLHMSYPDAPKVASGKYNYKSMRGGDYGGASSSDQLVKDIRSNVQRAKTKDEKSHATEQVLHAVAAKSISKKQGDELVEVIQKAASTKTARYSYYFEVGPYSSESKLERVMVKIEESLNTAGVDYEVQYGDWGKGSQATVHLDDQKVGDNAINSAGANATNVFRKATQAPKDASTPQGVSGWLAWED